MKWLKTTAYNNLSRNYSKTSQTSIKHKIFSPKGHQHPFHHLKIHKISFTMVSKLALGYLIPGLIQISSNWLILHKKARTEKKISIISKASWFSPEKKMDLLFCCCNQISKKINLVVWSHCPKLAFYCHYDYSSLHDFHLITLHNMTTEWDG